MSESIPPEDVEVIYPLETQAESKALELSVSYIDVTSGRLYAVYKTVRVSTGYKVRFCSWNNRLDNPVLMNSIPSDFVNYYFKGEKLTTEVG